MKSLGTREFFRMLRRRTKRTAEKIDRLIHDRAAKDVAVLVSDSSGFTRKSHEYGVLHFLSVMTQVYGRIFPLFDKHGARLISQPADNLLAVFPDPARALAAATEIQKRLRKFNAGKSDADQFHLCIGIETGKAIVLDDDVFGDCVNIASKLGEDLADKGEILVTGGVARAVKSRFRCSYARSTAIGGRPFEIYRVSY